MRLDRALVARGLVRSRTRAQELIGSGDVLVDGRPVTKPSHVVADESSLEVAGGGHYVSRAAHKLSSALAACPDLDPRGRVCLDVGASTGGFTQVLLERGATTVHAVDVGHDQMAPLIAEDPRVVVTEGLNARELTAADLHGDTPDLAVADVSFISLTLIIPAVVSVLAPDADVLFMVKPQFEVGREGLGRGGVVTQPAARARAVAGVVAALTAQSFDIHSIEASALPGTHGNVEYFVWASRTWQASASVRPRPPGLDSVAIAAAISAQTGGTP